MVNHYNFSFDNCWRCYGLTLTSGLDSEWSGHVLPLAGSSCCFLGRTLKVLLFIQVYKWTVVNKMQGRRGLTLLWTTSQPGGVENMYLLLIVLHQAMEKLRTVLDCWGKNTPSFMVMLRSTVWTQSSNTCL